MRIDINLKKIMFPKTLVTIMFAPKNFGFAPKTFGFAPKNFGFAPKNFGFCS